MATGFVQKSCVLSLRLQGIKAELNTVMKLINAGNSTIKIDQGFAISCKTDFGIDKLKEALDSIVPKEAVPSSYEKLLKRLNAEPGTPFLMADHAQQLALSEQVSSDTIAIPYGTADHCHLNEFLLIHGHTQIGITSGRDVHVALCTLSAQGALFYSDCMGDATPSGVKQVHGGSFASHFASSQLDFTHRARLWCYPLNGLPTRWRVSCVRQDIVVV